MLVGNFDRPNLTYRVLPRVDVARAGAAKISSATPSEAAIVYCISRSDADDLAAVPASATASRPLPYHAGLDADAAHADAGRVRRRSAATSSSPRSPSAWASTAPTCASSCTPAMPKSIEHYQQETGRAGRDGLEAECVLLYSGADVMRWDSLIARNANDADATPESIAASRQLLEHMQPLCGAAHCRHRKLSEYFGQAYAKPNCDACDVCLGDVEGLADATVVAQKILSCVARVGERFGVDHIVDVLVGANTERVRPGSTKAQHLRSDERHRPQDPDEYVLPTHRQWPARAHR